MKLSYLPVKSLPPVVQSWFRPMLLLSLGLHGLFLSFPTPPPSNPKSTPPKKEEKVKITQLLAAPNSPSPTPSPQPSVQVSPSTPQPTPQRVIPPLPQQATLPPPIPKQTTEPKQQPEEKLPKKPLPEEEESKKTSPEEEPSKKPSPEEEESKKSSPEEEQSKKSSPEDNFQAGAEAGKGLLEVLRPKILERLLNSPNTNDPEYTRQYLDTLPYEFVKSEQQYYFLEGENQLKKDALSFLAIPQTNPQGAYEEYIKPVLEEELDFKTELLKEQYGDADLYQAHNDQNVKFYMSLVKLTGSGALVVIWDKNPYESTADVRR